jgi:hypothetical protein
MESERDGKKGVRERERERERERKRREKSHHDIIYTIIRNDTKEREEREREKLGREERREGGGRKR